MSPGDGLLVVAAGFVGGGVNALAGGGTLLTYPALLAAGLPPVLANTTSSVGLLAGYAGGSFAYRRELEGQRARATRLIAAAVVGAAVGAVLLLAVSGDAFKAIVPFLVLMACVLLAVQPRVAAWLRGRRAAEEHPLWVAQLLIGLGAVYGSYFGAGLGVVMLAILGLLVADGLQRLNALKGVLSLVINLIGALIFVVTGHVRWGAAALLAIGAFGGATLGVSLARRLPANGIRAGVVVAGLAVAVALLVKG
ncbi:MAG: sulfite exporter TauE/SafE family protein [Mycobacteriales bacterium]